MDPKNNDLGLFMMAQEVVKAISRYAIIFTAVKSKHKARALFLEHLRLEYKLISEIGCIPNKEDGGLVSETEYVDSVFLVLEDHYKTCPHHPETDEDTILNEELIG